MREQKLGRALRRWATVVCTVAVVSFGMSLAAPPARAEVPNLTNWWVALDCDSPYPLDITVNSAPPGIGVDQLNATPLYVQGPGTGWILASPFVNPFTTTEFGVQNDASVVMPVPMHYQDVVNFRWGGGTGSTPDGTLIASSSAKVGAAGSFHYGGCDASQRILDLQSSPWYCSSPTASGTITVTTGFSGTLMMNFFKDGDWRTPHPASLTDLGDGKYAWSIPLLSIVDPAFLQDMIDNRDRYANLSGWFQPTAELLIDREPTVRYFYALSFFPTIPICTTDPAAPAAGLLEPRFTG